MRNIRSLKALLLDFLKINFYAMTEFFLILKRLPVKTLQLEQMAVVGCAEEPSVVASRMRLVFSTLEVCHVPFKIAVTN